MFAVVGSMIACASLSGRLEARQLTLEDYYRVIGVQAPAMSPDGKWVAFVRSTIVEADNRRQGELWIVARPTAAHGRAASRIRRSTYPVRAGAPDGQAPGLHRAPARRAGRRRGRIDLVRAARIDWSLPPSTQGRRGHADLQSRQQVDRVHEKDRQAEDADLRDRRRRK
jgi:dipeptidyl aminopeptidase/acylaminoacyl peptidase